MTKQSTQFLAPAKLNLFLHITGRREDGYHELQTVFQLLDFGDQMAFEVSNDGILSLHLSSSKNIETDTPLDNNLVTSAAALLRLEAGNPHLGASISLNKQLPSGAGLGGGSSNAATCLAVLNRLWELNLSTDKLCEIGVKLGADVPVFIRGKIGLGRGNRRATQPCRIRG